MRHLILGVVALAGLAGFTGCGSMSGNNIVKYQHNTKPAPPTEAPRDGTYGLYYWNDINPTTKYELDKGDQLGFISREGKVYAVAGDKEVEVQTTAMIRSVYWKEEPRRDR